MIRVSFSEVCLPSAECLSRAWPGAPLLQTMQPSGAALPWSLRGSRGARLREATGEPASDHGLEAEKASGSHPCLEVLGGTAAGMLGKSLCSEGLQRASEGFVCLLMHQGTVSKSCFLGRQTKTSFFDDLIMCLCGVGVGGGVCLISLWLQHPMEKPCLDVQKPVVNASKQNRNLWQKELRGRKGRLKAGEGDSERGRGTLFPSLHSPPPFAPFKAWEAYLCLDGRGDASVCRRLWLSRRLIFRVF